MVHLMVTASSPPLVLPHDHLATLLHDQTAQEAIAKSPLYQKP